MFHRNESDLDRRLRALIGVILVPAGLLLFGASAGGLLGLAVAVFGTLSLLTAVTGFCALYWLFGLSTLKPGGARAADRGLM